MATSTLTVINNDDITLDNVTYGEQYEFTESNVEEVIELQTKVPQAASKTILAFGTGATDDLESFDYFRIYNRDNSNFITVGLISTGAEAVYHKVKPNQSLIITSNQINTNVTGGAFSAFVVVDTITVQADTADVICKYLVAKKQ